jgi:uncharacterized cupin superfamily protein
MSSHLVPFDLADILPEESTPAPDRIVSGEPTMRTWNVEEAEDGRTLAGVWEATPGAWRVAYDEWEFCTILSGASVLMEEGAEPMQLTPGVSFVIRPGFRGVWQVLETTRKLYVVRLP